MKLAVLGGTFDPIHSGHLAVAGEVKDRLSADQVLLVPAGRPWLKEGSPITAAAHRINMVRLAIADIPYCEVSTMEIDRAGATYTLDTLAELWKRLGSGDELFFVLGWSSLSELPRWKEPERIIKLCTLVAVPRPGYARPDVKALEASIPGLTQRVIILEKPQVDISASDIRERVAKGLSISGLVPEVVERYISKSKLYLTS